MIERLGQVDSVEFRESSWVCRLDNHVRRYGDDALVAPAGAGAPIALDPAEWLTYQLLDGEATVGELADDVHEVVGVPRPVALANLHRTIGRLDRAGLLVGARPVGESELDDSPFIGPPNP